ncbi:MAG: hypothetical protein QGG53_25615, partial [Planctomycetota bacterium]|nr:hypothetical protein [Planctomycetota bacterium]
GRLQLQLERSAAHPPAKSPLLPVPDHRLTRNRPTAASPGKLCNLPAARSQALPFDARPGPEIRVHDSPRGRPGRLARYLAA